MILKSKALALTVLTVLSAVLMVLPHAHATLYISWNLNTTTKGEFITAYAHLYGVPQIEKNYNIYFAVVTIDARYDDRKRSGVIEVSIGDYAQPAKVVYDITQYKVYTYGLNPTFNDKVGQISSPKPVTVDLKVTDNSGNQIYADSKNIQMLPVNYYVWSLSKSFDMIALSPVLATPHADPVQKVISAAAKATPWNGIVGYQETRGYNHSEVVEWQMRAVYNVVRNLGILYVDTSPTFTSSYSQRIKVPVQTLSDASGNCIETTLLFDSIFEAVGFDTYLIFITGHVFVGVGSWLDSDTFFPLETTMVGTATYDEARTKAHQEYSVAKSDPGYYWLDVKKMRTGGVQPTPYMDSMSDASRFNQKVDELSAKTVSAKTMIGKVEDAMKGKSSIPSKAQDLYHDAQRLFKNGDYPAAEKDASDALNIMNQPSGLLPNWSFPNLPFPTGMIPQWPGTQGLFGLSQQNIFLIGIISVIVILAAVVLATRRR